MFRPEVWLISTLFCFGVIAGMILSWPSATSPKGDNLDAAGQLAAQLAEPSRIPSVAQLTRYQSAIERGDRLLLAGSSRDAALAYRLAINGENGVVLPEHLLRFALALEMAGYFSQAESVYVDASQHSADPRLGLLATSGLARTWQATGNGLDALKSLSDLTLRKAEMRPFRDAAGEAQLLLAQSLIARGKEVTIAAGLPLPEIWPLRLPMNLEGKMALLNSPMAPAETPEGADSNESIDGDLNDRDSISDSDPQTGAKPVAAPQATLRDGVNVVQKPVADPDLISLDVSLPVNAIAMILEQLSAATDLPTRIEDDALEILRGRSKVLRMDGVTLAMVLDALLLPLDLMWEWRDGEVVISKQARHPTEEVARSYYRAANRLLEQFQLEYAEDTRLPFARGIQGNVQMLLQDNDRALVAFESILQSDERGNLSAVCYLNLAEIQKSLRRMTEVRELLFKAVDSTADLNLKSHAYRMIADIALEEGDFAVAVQTAERSTRLGTDNLVKEAAALTLARAYLLTNRPIAANQALYDSRRAFVSPRALHLASLLGAYARFVGTGSEVYRRNESQRLLIELAMARQEEQLQGVDDYLAAKAFQMLGFEEDCIQLLQRALAKSVNDYWRRRLAFELAVLHHQYGESERALQVLDLIDDGTPSELAILVHLERAKIHLDRQEPESCLQAARPLFGLELSDDQKRVALEIMGQAYRRLGLHYSAALCYAGVLPNQ